MMVLLLIQEIKIMKHIIESIKVVLQLGNTRNSHSNKGAQQAIECNYENNYYGDQHCKLKKIKQ